MKQAFALLAIVTCACQQPSLDTDAIADLRLRVRVLEQGQKDIVSEMRENAAKQSKLAAAPATPLPMTFKLLPNGSVYPNKKRCDAAMDVALQARAKSEAEMATRGLRTLTSPSIYCLPL